MAGYRILVSDGLSEEGLARLRSIGEVTADPKIAPLDLIAALPAYDALVVRSRTKVTASVLEAGKRLKVVGRAGVGVDNIDVPAAQQRGITVVNSPLAATAAVAEHTLALMLALARGIPAADRSMKADRWEKSSFMGSELLGKTLGLVGIGNVGGAVARMARGLGMAVVAFDPYARPEKAASLGVLLATLDEVLASADFLSVHAPKNDGTRDLLDAKAFAKMKTGVFVVNCARGGIVVEKDLVAALEAGKVRGAGVDVFEQEPPADWTLARHPKVIATPHLGATTGEAQVNVSVMIARQVGAYLTRGEVVNAVNAVS